MPVHSYSWFTLRLPRDARRRRRRALITRRVSSLCLSLSPYTPHPPKKTICGLARATPNDINRAYEAIKEAKFHRIHTFLATSDIHLKWKLRISREDCIAKAVAAVKHAKSLCEDIEFSPEDAGRLVWLIHWVHTKRSLHQSINR